MKFTVYSTASADTAHTFELSAERLAELLDGEEFDPDNEGHRDIIADEFYESGQDMPTICAQCSGWNREHELSIGDDWEVTDITVKED